MNLGNWSASLSSLFTGLSFVLKGNDNHDRLGRFATTAGGPASKFAEKANRATATPQRVIDLALGDHSELKAEFSAAHLKMLTAVRNGEESYREHVTNLKALDDGTQTRPAFSEARLDLHRRIIKDIIGDASAFVPEKGTAPSLILLAGRGGSGKGHFDSSKGLDSGVYSAKTHLVLDPDNVKRRIPGYDPEMAGLTHRESVIIFDKLMQEAKRQRLNVVLDTTLNWSAKSIVKSFGSKSYDMEAHFMHMPPVAAAVRAVSRWKDGEALPNGTKSKRGRLVAPEVILANVDNEKNFDAILPKMKKWSLWANDQPRNVPPRRISGSADPVAKFEGLSHVLKNNPYHGPDGKFASHGSATFISSWGKKNANIDMPGHQNKNTTAAKVQNTKLKGLAHTLGVHVRGGGTLDDSFGKAALAQAKLHAEGVKTYGNHSNGLGGVFSRQGVDELVAQAFAKSNLPAHVKTKAGIPLTPVEQEIFAKAKAYNTAQHSKVQSKKAVASVAALSEEMAGLEAHNLSTKAHAAAVKKLQAKTTKAIAMADKHGAALEQVLAAVAEGVNAHNKKTDDAVAEIKDAAHAAELQKHVGSPESSLAASQHLAAVKAKHAALLPSSVAGAAHSEVVKTFEDNKDAHVNSLADHYVKAYAPAAPVTDVVAYSDQHDYVVKNFGAAAAVSGTNLGKEKVMLAPVQSTAPLVPHAVAETSGTDLKVKTKPKAPKAPKATPVEANKVPTTLEEAESLLDATGKKFYMLKESKFPTASKDVYSKDAEVSAAFNQYADAKAHYAKQGGKKESGALSSGYKSQAQAAIKATQYEEMSIQQKHKDTVMDTSKKMEAAAAAHGKSSPQYKSAKMYHEEAVKAATGVGLAPGVIQTYTAAGSDLHTSEHVAKIKKATSDITSAASNMHTVLAAHKDTNHPDVLAAGSALQSAINTHSGTLSVGYITAAKKAGTDIAKANIKSVATAKKLYGAKAATAISNYDKTAESFAYPNGDTGSSFSNHGVGEIAKLSAKEKTVISSYSGSAFTDLNKAVGKAGTALSNGQPYTPLSPALRAQVVAMDSAFAKTTLGANVKLRRNMAQKYMWDALGVPLSKLGSLTDADLAKHVGRTYKETAYSSTSTRKDFTAAFSGESSKTGEALLHIRAGAGMPGVHAKSIAIHKGEDEVILPRGTTYVIRGIKRLADFNGKPKFEFHVDMLGAFPDKLP